MSFKPFVVGIIASSAISYNILSQLADRRLFGLPKLSEEEILALDYQKVNKFLFNLRSNFEFKSIS